jgi:hypothetical protein
MLLYTQSVCVCAMGGSIGVDIYVFHIHLYIRSMVTAAVAVRERLF